MKGSQNSILFTILVLTFLGYSVFLYTKPEKPLPPGVNKDLAVQGRIVWQKYNCQSCHQLYGLGGYLGPDLTNEYSTLYKGEDAIRAFVRSGTPQMPAFSNMTEEELKSLVEFLKMTDASGKSDPRQFNTDALGNIFEGKEIKQ